jgi:hypothetical protein
MSEIRKEGETVMEPLPISSAQKENEAQNELKEEYVRIL